MIEWLKVPDETKRRAYTHIAEKTGMSPFAAEKDWWVTQVLSLVFQTEIAPHLVFKGGTSLSKGWELIERFSEDVDLAIDRAYFGFGGDLERKEIEKLRKATGAFIDNEFLLGLQTKTAEKGLERVSFELVPGERSDRDRQINISYPNVIPSPGYLQPRVQLEFSCRSLMEPSSVQSFGSLLDKFYEDKDFAQPALSIAVVNPERTFLEKLFLLHEEFQKPEGRIRTGDRLSRHLYDVVKLWKSPFAKKAFTNPELYQTIVEHRQKFNQVPGVNYSLHQPQTLSPIPVASVRDAWQADYATMIEQMIYEQKPPSFNEIMDQLHQLTLEVNSLPWKMQYEL
jgi:predicted nucleotidyltransferase component of viral defense system